MRLDSDESSKDKYSYTLLKEYICPKCGHTVDEEYDDETDYESFDNDDFDCDKDY